MCCKITEKGEAALVAMCGPAQTRVDDYQADVLDEFTRQGLQAMFILDQWIWKEDVRQSPTLARRVHEVM